ncbi:MAG: segregation/condensation protein A [Nanoarchaeota archaeon]|nr:segregation/condensation protein A [Nanoarchaeota archaeon]MBU1632639.1 segregation/condensation protein A [Nanoarchaeota archaeon]MBU1876538.1 segregation/condensation protein A [Nanoarchaeota archaeon]
MQQKLFDLLLDKDEISWKTIIYDLVKSEEMDPWDIDLTILTKRFIQVIKEMKENDLKIPGKILLAAAVLLKIKATHLVDNDITNLDRLINQAEEENIEEELLDGFEEGHRKKNERQKFVLIPRNPQPRNRKVSINDLVDALQRAIAAKRKILAKQRPVKYTMMPKSKFDIMEVIRDIYHKITYYTIKDKRNKLTFTKLLPPRAGKLEKVYTFLPLLHLENQRKIETEQRKHFDEIYINLIKSKGQKAK